MAWSLHIFHQKSGYEVFLAHTTDFLMTTDNKIVLLQKTLYFYYFFSFLLMQQLFSVFMSVPLWFVCLFIFPSDLNARVSVYRCDIHTHSLIWYWRTKIHVHTNSQGAYVHQKCVGGGDSERCGNLTSPSTTKRHLVLLFRRERKKK